MKFFPLSINSKNKKVLIIGGGRSSLIKTKTLLMGEFLIDLIAIDFLDDFYKLESENKDRLKLIKKKVDKDFDEFSCDFLILATDDKALNKTLRKKGKALKIPLLDTTHPEDSDFFLNKICKKEDIAFSVSTSGKSPSLSKYLAEDFTKYIENKDYEKVALLIKLRSKLKKRKSANIAEIMNKAMALEKDQLKEYMEGLYDD